MTLGRYRLTMGVVGSPRGERRMRAQPKVVITMPAYKAEATLARTVADIPAGLADHLILVDDASPDNTAALARSLGIDVHVHPRNRGYGENQKTCYTLALHEGADVVVMLHPDYQYEPKAVPLLIAPILAGDADMTFGSRFSGLSDPRAGGMPLHRFVGNRLTTIVENVLLGSRFTEMHSGMRAYTRECMLSLPFLRYAGDFVFDSQLLIDAVTTGQRVVEVPIPTRYTEESSSIGTGSSVSYVSGSIAYCFRRVWSHGRKRHRTPVGRPRREIALRPEESPLERMLDLLSGYTIAGRRAVVAGSSNDRDVERIARAGWEAVGEGEPAQVALLLTQLAHDGSALGFRDLIRRLEPEGMLAALGTTGTQVEAELAAAGVRLVEWCPLSRADDAEQGIALGRAPSEGGDNG